jgi:CheY-like chemotaxis protein
MLRNTEQEYDDDSSSQNENQQTTSTLEILSILQETQEIKLPLQSRRNSITELEKNIAALSTWFKDYRDKIPAETIINLENICRMLSEGIRQLEACLRNEESFLKKAPEATTSLFDTLFTPLHGTLGITSQLKDIIKKLREMINNELMQLSGRNLSALIDICKLMTDNINEIEKNANIQGNAVEKNLRKLSPKTTPTASYWKNIPAIEADQVASSLSSLSLLASPKTVQPKKIKVLIIDDNKLNRTVLAGFLKDQAYHCIFADDGHNAIVSYLQERPEVILMDIVMPTMDGINATIAIRAIEKGLTLSPSIIIATTTEVLQQKNAEKAGMNDFIAKPFNKKIIVEKIADHLAQQQAGMSKRLT